MTHKNKSETDIRRVLQAYGSMLYRNAYLLLGNPHDVQDILQEVLLRYLEKAPSFHSADHEKAWLLRVSTNCCMDCLRFRKRHACTDLESLKECLAAPQQQEQLEELYALPAKWKTVLILYYFEGYSVTEIAQITRLSASAVKKRLQRGRKALKIAVSETQPDAVSMNNSQYLIPNFNKKESYHYE